MEVFCDDSGESLFQACRTLLRYDGIDKERVQQAVDHIREIVDYKLDQLEIGEG